MSAFFSATVSAGWLISESVTDISGRSSLMVMPMQPDPVPTSSSDRLPLMSPAEISSIVVIIASDSGRGTKTSGVTRKSRP